MKFKNKEPVKEVNKAKYLGCMLCKDSDTTMEVRGRIREAMGILKKMHCFWRHSDCTLRFKLVVMQAVLYSKILFGLESAELTTGALRILDVFHLKCLRKILKIKTTYVDRANTNAQVYARANAMLKEGETITTLSKVYLTRKQNFYCQVVQAGADNPIRTVTFQRNTTLPIQHLPRRRGRPKVKWAHTEAKKLWNGLQTGPGPKVEYNPRSTAQGVIIHQLIRDRKKKP